MVRLTRIYTRGGDAGLTSLADGSRVPKHGWRVAAIGAVDESNAAVGLARLHVAGGVRDVEPSLARVQNDLFDVGADLARPGDGSDDGAALRATDAQVRRIEREIDAVNADLPPLDSFVLPGGTAAAAHLHLARALVRRAERATAALAEAEPVNPAALRYLNRVSDLFFVWSRTLNAAADGDILWRPGANRT